MSDPETSTRRPARSVELDAPTRRRPKARRLTPAQIRAVAQKYYAGSDIRSLTREFGIHRTSLYRYLKSYEGQPEAQHDATHWRIECERLKNVCVGLALENRALKDRLLPDDSGTLAVSPS